jgi:hypothetical protein
LNETVKAEYIERFWQRGTSRKRNLSRRLSRPVGAIEENQEMLSEEP